MAGDRLYELIALKLSGEASAAELQELHDLLHGNTGDQYLYEILDKYWSQQTHIPPFEADSEEESFHRILSATGDTDDIQPKAARPGFRRWLPYAAVLLAVAGTILFFYLNNNRPSVPASVSPSNMREVVAQAGIRSKIILPDGTQVWLNAESKITWLNSFNNNTTREVNLEGEAYFDVVHDPKRPFIVHTSGIDIRVLGTVFTVKSYPSDNTIETTLLRGLVEVLKKDDPSVARVILRPSEKLVFNKKQPADIVAPASSDIKPAGVKTSESGMAVTRLVKDKPDSLRKETSWVYNKLVFEGDRFDELAAKMERWYNVRISFENERLKQYRFKGVFENESVQEALEALKLTAKFEFDIDGKEIAIYD